MSRRVCDSYNALQQQVSGANNTVTATHMVCDEEMTTGRHVHCFASWRNVSGVVEVVSKGCWLDSEQCPDTSVCRSDHVDGDVFFCCCNGDLCNVNFTSSFLNVTARHWQPDDVNGEYTTDSGFGSANEVFSPLLKNADIVFKFNEQCYWGRYSDRSDERSRVVMATDVLRPSARFPPQPRHLHLVLVIHSHLLLPPHITR